MSTGEFAEMPPSMRRQTRIEKHRSTRDKQRKEARTLAVKLLTTTSLSVKEVVLETGLSQSAVYTLKRLCTKSDTGNLSRLLNSVSNRAGRNRILTDEEESMICDRMIFSANRGFAMSVLNLKCVIRRMVTDGRNGVPEGYPSDDVVRSFRARHREITYRRTENKDAAKIRGETFEHVKTYDDVLLAVDKDFPGMLQDPDRVWNMDETAVNVEYGVRTKSFTSSSSHYGGFKAVAQASNGKHITAVIATSASWLIAPPFFIVAGKNVMSKWFSPFQKKDFDLNGTNLHSLNDNGWFPGDGCVVCSENGSMEMSIMPLFVEHLNRFVRKTVPASQKYLLCLDGHASRKVVEWLHACFERNFQAVQSPANTTQVLQPCDQDINSKFNTTVRKTRDSFCTFGSPETCSVRAKLMCAVQAHNSLTLQDIHSSFSKTGLWPVKFDLANRFRTTADQQQAHANAIEERASGTQRVSLRHFKRTDDECTAGEIMRIMERNIGPSRKLQAVQIVLKRSETVNDVLMTVEPGAPSKRSSVAGSVGRREDEQKKKLV